jgi:hypothetical protein
MSCKDYKQRISLSVTGDLPENEREAVARHMRECLECRDDLEALRELATGLRAIAIEDENIQITRDFVTPDFYSAPKGQIAECWISISAAALVLVASALWLILGSGLDSHDVAREVSPMVIGPRSANVIARVPSDPTVFEYLQAWKESPKRFDELLRPVVGGSVQRERTLRPSDVFSFMKMNKEENENANHSMRRGGFGNIVKCCSSACG